METISVITPTYQRDPFLQRAYRQFKAQTYAATEWLILDDSPEPSAFFQALTDPRVHYTWHPDRLSIGAKRNRLAAQAQGTLIAHWDDDDLYAPHYLQTMAQAMADQDFVKLRGWHVHSAIHAFWGYFDSADPTLPSAFCLDNRQPLQWLNPFELDITMQWGYGYSYVYRRTLWENYPFQELNFGEDHHWVIDHLLDSSFRLCRVDNANGLAVQVVHAGSGSQAFPQYRLPNWMIPADIAVLLKA